MYSTKFIQQSFLEMAVSSNCYKGTMVQFVDVHCTLNTPFTMSTLSTFGNSPPATTHLSVDMLWMTPCGLEGKETHA